MPVVFDDEIKPKGKVVFDEQPVEPQAFTDKVSQAIANRRAMGEEIQANPNISNPSKYFQLYGKVGGGAVNDIAGITLSQLTPDFVGEAAKSIYKAVTPQVVQDYISSGSQKSGEGWNKFHQAHPELAGNIESIGNLVNVGLSANPARQAVSGAGKATLAAGKAAVTVPTKLALGTTLGAAKISDKAAQGIGTAISKQVVQANLPTELKGLPNAEALFMRTLKEEGVTPEAALRSMETGVSLGASPSVAATANIPSMKEIGFMMSRGSKGSAVAAKAEQSIRDVQIPTLNKKIIETATGGKQLSAEEYGQTVSKLAKETIDKQAQKLKTRAAPYYAEAVGLDKSIEIQSPMMQKVLQNPLATKALEDARTDAFTKTNVINDLADLGVDASGLEKLPYNSTVSLHAARTHLRGMADAAYAAGEKQKGKAIKAALTDIDNAIESQYPSYKKARAIYSEDAGALKVLKDSPMGQMAILGEGDLSRVANNLMSKDPSYIKKFMAKVQIAGGEPEKMRSALAGAYMQRGLEDAAKNGMSFSQAFLKNETRQKQLKAIVGAGRYDKIAKINKAIDELNETVRMTQGSRTSVAQAIRDEGGSVLPTNKVELLQAVKSRYTPSLVDLVRNNPIDAARFNQLLFTDEGYKLLQKMSNGSVLNVSDMNKLSDFLKNPPPIKMIQAEEILPGTQQVKALLEKAKK